MVVHNCSQFIEESVNSILNQTYDNFEFIIVDDASTDDTNTIIKSFSDRRIKCFKNHNKLGIVKSRNIALRNSKGKYIAIQDADDISYLNRLELSLEFLETNPTFGLVGGRAELINDRGEKLNKTQSLSLSSDETKVYLLFNNCFTHSTIMYRKKILSKFQFNENYQIGEDYEIIVKIASQKKVKNLQEKLGAYRLHNSNISNGTSFIEKYKREIISMQLEQIGLEYNEDELNVHLKLNKKPLHKDLELLIKQVKWLNKLYNSNSIFNYYPIIAFNKRISGYWFNLMNNSKDYNFKLIPLYFLSPIRKNSNRNFIDNLKFFIKCIIKVKN